MEEINSVLEVLCVSITGAATLILVPCFRRCRSSSLLGRDQVTALSVFAVLELIGELNHSPVPGNGRIVLICSAGLLAGPWVGAAVALFGSLLAVAIHGLELPGTVVGTLCAGLSAGLLNDWRPRLAVRPLTGFYLTSGISVLQVWFVAVVVGGTPVALNTLIKPIAIAALLQGSGTAFMLAVAGQVCLREKQTRARVLAEIRMQRRRMDPHFLFNALNTVAAVALVAPSKVAKATARLREVLGASFAQDERILVPLEEELALVRSYLEIELLRFGERLNVVETIDESLLLALVPPFSFQPLIENAVQHGVRSSSGVGRLQISVQAVGRWLEMSVTDNGLGVPSAEIEQTFFLERRPVHALTLLRQRLRGLFGDSFQMEVRSAVGEGTTVIMRIALQAGRLQTVVPRKIEESTLPD